MGTAIWYGLWVLAGAIAIGGGLLAVSEIGYQRGTIDPWTLSARVKTWRLGLHQVVQHPLLLFWIFVRIVSTLTKQWRRSTAAETQGLLVAVAVVTVGFATRNLFDYMFAAAWLHCFGFSWPLVFHQGRSILGGSNGMKQVLIKLGNVVVEDASAPNVEAGTVVVQVRHSCILIGTELSGLKASVEPLWRRAIPCPAKVKKVIAMVLERGLAHTISYAQGALMSGQPTGYSASGVALAVGSDVPTSGQPKFRNGLHDDKWNGNYSISLELVGSQYKRPIIMDELQR